MNRLIYKSNINEENYTSPSIDVYSVKVEAGFEASLPNVTIAPWESDNDSLEL